MNVKEKLQMNIDGLYEHGPINIVIFGDSVSHGCLRSGNNYETVYWNLLKQKMNAYRDYVPVNMINASIGGTTAKRSLPRFEKQVLKHEPDLVIVAFGLNDVNYPLEEYLDALRQIFAGCQAAGSEVIFLTPNMLNTYVAEDTKAKYKEYAAETAEYQNSGRMDMYMHAAMELSQSMCVPICDCYSKWKELAKTQDTTQLLINRINHPCPEMHKLFADALYEMIIGEGTGGKGDNTMVQKT
jgi:lysophospholipase L1-like esterase